jgi:hypothetical protein
MQSDIFHDYVVSLESVHDIEGVVVLPVAESADEFEDILPVRQQCHSRESLSSLPRLSSIDLKLEGRADFGFFRRHFAFAKGN